MSRQRWRKNYEQPSRFNNYAKGTRSHYNSELYNARIIQRNLVYVIGLAPEISTERVKSRSRALIGILDPEKLEILWAVREN